MPSIFLGHASDHRGYRCLDLNTNKIIISRHVTFDETVFPYGTTQPNLSSTYTFLDDIPDLLPHNTPSPNVTPPTIPQNIATLNSLPPVDIPIPSTVPSHGSDYLQPNNFHPTYIISPISSQPDPTTHYTIGYHSPTSPPTAQHPLILVVKPGTIRTVLSLAASQHWPIHQLDVKNAFLHGDLSEMVYMHQPPGFQDSTHPDYVSLLQRSLYGLKQALRAWFQRIFLSQKKYAVEILERAGMVNCNPSRTPDTKFKLDLVANSDADWAGCPTTRRLTSGYFIFLGNNLLSWSSKRQPTLSHSSTEAEYRGVANAVAETCWLRNLLRELHTPLSSAMLVYCDNISAMYLSTNSVQHQHTKHIEIDIHFVRDLFAAGQVRVLHVPCVISLLKFLRKACLLLCLRSLDLV
ncbi:ribonuclease H-like domain-containing protein [Tanacetum coccineum]